MRGGFSDKIKELRQQLLNFSSLIELELDFGEEDVEFADRTELLELLSKLESEINNLIESFSLGNVMKNGIPVAIIGKPNVGKSTLLNALLNEEKAIVSEIPGTTRDIIEDTIVIKGVSFRFIDTAGLRDGRDEIETIGIERTHEKIKLASIVLYVFDISSTTIEQIKEVIEDFKNQIKNDQKRLILIGNKIDKLIEMPDGFKDLVELETIFISAKRKENINLITESLLKSIITDDFQDTIITDDFQDTAIVTNTRHYEALTKASEALSNIKNGFNDNIPTDLISIDIRDALHYLGEITGEITTDEILGNIFGKFCIGK
jgi:tRNA modification GTPase